MFKNIFFFLLLVLLYPLPSNGQSVPYKKFTVKDGLPTDKIYRIIEDNQGFIWVATDKGVCKYDGYEFKCFTVNEGLPSNDVYNINIDSKNRKWLSTVSNTLCYIENDSVKFGFDIENYDLIELVYAHNNGVAALTSKDYTYQIDNRGKLSVENCFNEYSLSDKFKIQRTDKDLKVLDENDKEIINYDEYGVDHFYSTDQIYDDHLFFSHADGGGVVFIDLSNGTASSIRIPDLKGKADPRAIVIQKVANDGRYQIYFDGKLYIISSEGIVEREIFIDRIDRGFIISAALDRQDNLWLSTSRGLYLLSSYKKYHEVKYLDWSKDQKFTMARVYDDKNYFASEEGKIIGLDDSVSDIIVDFSEGFFPYLYDFNFFNKLLFTSIRGSGLKYHKLSDEYSNPHVEAVSCPSDLFTKYLNPPLNYKKIEFDGNHIYGIGSNAIRATTLDLNFSCINRNRVYKNVSYGERCNQLMIIADDSLYYMSTHNRSKYNNICHIGNDSSVDYLGGSSFMINDNNNYSICDSTGCLPFDELWSYNLKSVKRINLDTWINTDHGLFKYHGNEKLDKRKSLEKVLDYHKLDLYNEVNDISYLDSTFYLLSNDGIYTAAYKEELIDSLLPIRLAINGELGNDYINLSYNKRHIDINFSTREFPSKDKVDYFYKMDGVDEDPVQTSLRDVSYNKLSAGEYTFSVYAENKSGVKSDIENIRISIDKPWWGTIWFYLCLSLFTFYMVSKLYQYILKREERKSMVNQKYATLELNALQSQMNPHFVFNALSSIQNLVINNKNKQATQYISKFASLMRMYLDASNHKFIPIEQEMKIIEEYLAIENLRFDGKLEVIVENNLSNGAFKSLIPATLIHPFVENSIIHGLFHSTDDQVLKISLSETDQNITVVIDDNGVGLHKSKELSLSNSKGYVSRAMQILDDKLAIIKKVDQYNILFKVEDKSDINKGRGTLVTIDIKKSV